MLLVPSLCLCCFVYSSFFVWFITFFVPQFAVGFFRNDCSEEIIRQLMISRFLYGVVVRRNEASKSDLYLMYVFRALVLTLLLYYFSHLLVPLGTWNQSARHHSGVVRQSASIGVWLTAVILVWLFIVSICASWHLIWFIIKSCGKMRAKRYYFIIMHGSLIPYPQHSYVRVNNAYLIISRWYDRVVLRYHWYWVRKKVLIPHVSCVQDLG